LQKSDFLIIMTPMSERVTATEAARKFSDLLNRVRYSHETFVVMRGGEEVAQISPAQPSQPVTLRELIERLRQIGLPDSRFAADLEEIQASQPPIGEAPWPS
jgi:prevent-host-death family protein